MSKTLDASRMPSLRDKIRDQAEAKPVKKEAKKVKVVAKKKKK